MALLFDMTFSKWEMDMLLMSLYSYYDKVDQERETHERSQASAIIDKATLNSIIRRAEVELERKEVE